MLSSKTLENEFKSWMKVIASGNWTLNVANVATRNLKRFRKNNGIEVQREKNYQLNLQP